MTAKKSPSSAVKRAAHALRASALACDNQEMIGSEEELVARYGVSRPTLRQAAALLIQEQLLLVKRGIGGGYFATRPNSIAVTHMTAIYLHSHDTTLEEIIVGVQAIRVELARLACANRAREYVEEMREFLAREHKRDLDSSQYKVFLRGEREFGEIIGKMGRNKVLRLFLEILYDYAELISKEEDLYLNKPDRVIEYRSKRNQLAEAIVEGDEELAMVMARRLAKTASKWMIDDYAAHNGPRKSRRSPNSARKDAASSAQSQKRTGKTAKAGSKRRRGSSRNQEAALLSAKG